MRTLFLAVALAVSLAPTPSRASFVAVAFAAIQAGAGVAAAFGAALGIGTFATKLIFGVALSLVGQLFAKKPENIRPSGIQTEQTTTGDTTGLKFVVGRYALEGHAVAPAYSRGKNNIVLTYILEVSNIPVKGLTGRVAIDGQWANILGTAPVGRDAPTAKALEGFNEKGKDHAWIWFEDGTQTAAHPHLVAAYGSHPDRPWTTDHKLLGSAYAILEFVTDQDLFSGLPSVRFEVEGVNLYDPRKDTTVGGSGSHRWDDPSTWEWTDNPQVINYNILRGIPLETGDIYGGQVPAEDLPLDNWFAAMNECDVLIGDRKQYVAGFEIDTNTMEPAEVIEEMNRASFAQISEFGGVFRVRVGAPAAAVMHVTDDDFLTTEPMDFDPFPPLDGTANHFTGTYVEPNNIWEGTSLDSFVNATWEGEDGRRLSQEINLPAVSLKSQGQHLLESYAKDNRRFRVHRLALPPSFALLEPLDVITWTSEQYGYVNKLFEITKVEDRTNTLVQIVTVRERDSGDVAWLPAQDVPAPPAYNQFTNPDPIEMAGFAAAPLTLQDAGGADRRAAIRLSWDTVDIADDPLMQWQVRLAATQEIVTQGTTPVLDGEQIVTSGVIPGAAYEARGKFVLARATQWSTWQAATAPGVLIGTVDVEDGAVTVLSDAFTAATVSGTGVGGLVQLGAVQTVSLSVDSGATVRVSAVFQGEISSLTGPNAKLQGRIVASDGVSIQSLSTRTFSFANPDAVQVTYSVDGTVVTTSAGVWDFDLEVFGVSVVGPDAFPVTVSASERYLAVDWTKR